VNCLESVEHSELFAKWRFQEWYIAKRDWNCELCGRGECPASRKKIKAVPKSGEISCGSGGKLRSYSRDNSATGQ